MTSYLIRLALIASTFYFIFPMIPGVQFHGNILQAFLAGALFAFMGWVVESLAIAITALFAIGTLGLGLLILIPAWILGFWLLPAVVLKITAEIMPATLTLNGWEPAIWGGLIMLVIGIITGGKVPQRITKTTKTEQVAV
jgi:hypothetical protein